MKKNKLAPRVASTCNYQKTSARQFSIQIIQMNLPAAEK